MPSDSDSSHAASSPSFDDWELDQQLRHVERVLSKPKAKARAGERGRSTRIDPAHDGLPSWHPASRQTAAGDGPEAAEGQAPGSGLAWLALLLGLAAFVCGGVLLGWSVIAARDDLWARGIPFVVGGQIGLLLGLVLQLDRLWRAGRLAAVKLDRMDRQLHGLKETTAMLGTTHSSPAAAFYSHLAGGANPQLLLTDLKGQLDMLAVRIGQGEGRE